MDQEVFPEETFVKFAPATVLIAREEKDKDEKPLVKGNTQCLQTVKFTSKTRDVLDRIISPKQWEKDGVTWHQELSSERASALDVGNLRDELDRQLMLRGARERGLCSVRRELYDQCFDEVIRQVAIECAERGLLLLRIRNELRMSLDTFSNLYSSCIAFGIRKALSAQNMQEELNKKIEELQEAKKVLEKQVLEQRARVEHIERTTHLLRENEDRMHNEQIQFYKKQNQQLKAQLENMLVPKK